MLMTLIDRITGFLRRPDHFPGVRKMVTPAVRATDAIVPELLQTLGAARNNAVIYADHLRRAAVEYDIDTPERIASWLANLAHESGRFAHAEERLNYTAARLAAVWPARFADIVGQPTAQARQIAGKPEQIASIAYANRMGNGSPATGDGWRFRGRGLMQITGRDNYRAAADALGLPLLVKPDLLLDPEHAARSAAWFWHSRGLNALADVGDLAGITRRINGGINGHADRLALYADAINHVRRA